MLYYMVIRLGCKPSKNSNYSNQFFIKGGSRLITFETTKNGSDEAEISVYTLGKAKNIFKLAPLFPDQTLKIKNCVIEIEILHYIGRNLDA